MLPESLADWLCSVPDHCATLALRDDALLHRLAVGGGGAAAAEDFEAAANEAAAEGEQQQQQQQAAPEQQDVGELVFLCPACLAPFRLRPEPPPLIVFCTGRPLCPHCTGRTMFAQLAAGEPAAG